mgnify:CR=1 FL=1
MIWDKVIDVNTAKPGIYYFVDTFYNTIIKIDFIGSYEKTVTTDWDDHAVFKYVKYYNHFFHETHALGRKKEESMKWDKTREFLLLTYDDAVEFLIYMFNKKADNEREQLENKIKNDAEKLDSYLAKCNDNTTKFM